MAGMTPEEVARVAAELDARAGARIAAAHQDGRLSFRLVLETPAGREDLVLDLDPAFPRVHLAPHRPAPAAPSPWAAGLRRRIARSRLERARVVEGERALALDLARGEELWTLWFEGFGRGANLYLVDAAGSVAMTPRGDVARRRGCRVGDPFAPPTGQQGLPAPPAPAEPLGVGPSEVLASQAVAEAAARDGTRRAAQRDSRALAGALRRALARAVRELERLEADVLRGAEADRLEREAQALRAAFDRLAPGLDRLQVLLPGGGDETVELALDPRLHPQAQVALRVRQARKAARAASEVHRRLPAVQTRVQALQALLGEEAGCHDPADLAARAASIGVVAPPTPAERRAAGPARALPWRTYVSVDGWRILVGKDARGNDQLTTREAAPGDRFLHVRGASGSHVIVPVPRGKTVPLPTLLDAAELAVHFSARRGARRAEVDHADRRHVRKPRGAPPGTVVLERARTLDLAPDPARLARLLAPRPE